MNTRTSKRLGEELFLPRQRCATNLLGKLLMSHSILLKAGVGGFCSGHLCLSGLHDVVNQGVRTHTVSGNEMV